MLRLGLRADWAGLRDILLQHGLYGLLLALILVFGAISHSFLTVSNWTQIGTAACFLLCAAAGEVIVMITGEIDLGVGSIAYLSASTVYLTSAFPAAFSVFAALVVGLIAGAVSGGLVAYAKMSSLLTTLGLMIAYRGVSLLVTGGTVQAVGPSIVRLGRIQYVHALPLVVLLSLVLMCLYQIVASSTKFGAYCYAVGNSESAARKVGIGVPTVKLIAFCMSGAGAAISGILSTMYLGQVTTFTGRGMEFEAIAAVVIGGTSLFGGRGSVLPGALAGVLLLTVISNGLGTRGVSPYVYPFVIGSVVFVAIYLDSLKNWRRSSRAR